MVEYNKIETVFKRDTEGTKKLIEGEYRNPAVEYLHRIPWVWTEKVDGTNIRVHWDGHEVEFAGRTDKASIPPALVSRLTEYFGGERNAQLFEQTFGDKDVIIFGEGYGDKIQNGAEYTDDCNSVDFIAFDVMVGGIYLERENVEEIVTRFGVKTVPIVDVGSLDDAIAYMREHPKSFIGTGRHDMEGLVCRPAYELRDRLGNRIIVKIKWEDIKDLQQTL